MRRLCDTRGTRFAPPGVVARMFAAPRMHVLSLAVVMALTGCGRSLPPDIPDFKPPARLAVRERVEPELAAGVSDAPASEPPPAQVQAKPESPKPVEAPKPVKVEVKPETPPAPAPEDAAPTLVGTWRITEMTKNGQSMPGMDQIEMSFTFRDDNTLSMTMSSPQMPQAHTREGTYSLSDGQITITMENDTKTGSYAFEGSNRVTLTIDEMKLVMIRS